MDKNTEKAIKRLNSFFNFRKIKGAKALKNTKVSEAVPPLISLLEHNKAKVREAALDALLSLKGNAMNHLCSLWAESRDKGLEEIVLKGGYVASTPLHLNYLTSLKLGNIQEPSNTKSIDILLKLLNDRDREIVSNARQSIQFLTNETGINHLCSLWSESRDKGLEEIVLKGGYVASTPLHLNYLTSLKLGNIQEPSNTKSIDILLKLLDDRDSEIASNARQSIQSLTNETGINHLCSLWSESRDKGLEEIVLKGGYVASTPLHLNYLTSLKLGNIQEPSNTEGVDILLKLLDDRDSEIASNARQSIHSLTNEAGINRLCSLWSDGRDKVLEEIVVKGGYVPSTPLPLKYLTFLKFGNIHEPSNADGKGVDILLKLLDDRDSEIASNARQSIHSLTNESGINRLCSLWAESRDKGLEKILLKCGYIATNPPLLTAQTTLINGKNVKSLLSEDVLDTCIKDTNLKICKGAAEILIDNKGNDGYETLWASVKDNSYSSLAEALNEMKWFPNDPTERALFYFLANDLSAYHNIDFEHTYLRTWYETDGETLKQAIAARIRKSGDARLLAIFRTKRGGRKGKLAAHAVELQTEILAKEGNCPELFHLLTSATYTQGVDILAKLKEADWTNPDPHGKELQGRLEKLIHEDEKTNLPSIYSHAMYEDFRPMFLGNEKPPESEGALLSWTNDEKKFRKRSAALITLAEKGSTKLTDAANQLCGDPYWQVRMAAACAELLNPGTLSPANKALLEGDHVYYVQAILNIPSDGRLVDLTHDGLEGLKRGGLKSDVKNKPEKADNFFDLVKGFLPSGEREYLLILAEFMKTEVAVSEEAAYEAGEMDVEIEVDE